MRMTAHPSRAAGAPNAARLRAECAGDGTRGYDASTCDGTGRRPTARIPTTITANGGRHDRAIRSPDGCIPDAPRWEHTAHASARPRPPREGRAGRARTAEPHAARGLRSRRLPAPARAALDERGTGADDRPFEAARRRERL